MRRVITFVTFLFCSGVVWSSFAAHADVINRNTHELDLAELSKLACVSRQFQFQMTDYVPLTGLPKTDDGRIIGPRIVQQSLQHFFNEYRVDLNSEILSQAQKVNRGFRAQVGNNRSGFSFAFRPVEGRAEFALNSEGPIQSALTYYAWSNSTLLAVHWSF